MQFKCFTMIFIIEILICSDRKEFLKICVMINIVLKTNYNGLIKVKNINKYIFKQKNKSVQCKLSLKTR